MKRVLLTGATGFVGRQVLKRLLQKDVAISIISRSSQENFPIRDSKIIQHFITDNLFAEDNDWYENVCADIDIVIHVAWYARPGKYLESSLNLDCMSGTLAFARAAANQGIKKFIGVGTCFEYDLTSNQTLATNAPLKPTFLYSITKTATFQSLEKFFCNEGIDFLWTRIFYLYGEGEDDRRLVSTLRRKLSLDESVDLTSGNQIRDFMDVKLAGCIIADASIGSNTGAFNVCSGKGISIRQLAENIADEYGKRDLLNFGAHPDNIADAPYIVGEKTEVI